MEITVQPGRVTRILLGVLGLLVAASIGTHVAKYGFGHGGLMGLVPLFDVVEEANVPTWFSSALLLLAALWLGVIARVQRGRGDPFARHWLILAGVFVLLSLDETAQIHDLLDDRLRDRLQLHGVLHYAWVIPAGVFLAVLGIAYIRFLVSLPRPTLRRFVLAAALYVGGALGMEMVAGAYDDIHGYENAVTGTLATIEESMEMLGVVVFIHALMTHLGYLTGGFHLRIDGPETEGEPASEAGDGNG